MISCTNNFNTINFFFFFQLFDSSSLQHMKTFRTERPVNSASLSSLKEHVSVGLFIIFIFLTFSWIRKFSLKLDKIYIIVLFIEFVFLSALFQVVLGGGQEAMEVTTTSARVGKFDARFYHMIFEEEFARVKGHFGPINSVAFHPDGKRYLFQDSALISLSKSNIGFYLGKKRKFFVFFLRVLQIFIISLEGVLLVFISNDT